MKDDKMHTISKKNFTFHAANAIFSNFGYGPQTSGTSDKHSSVEKCLKERLS